MKYVFHFLIVVFFFIHFLLIQVLVQLSTFHQRPPTTWFPQLRGPDLFKPVCTAMVVPVWGKLRRGKLTSFLLGVFGISPVFSKLPRHIKKEMEIWKIPSFHFFRSFRLKEKSSRKKRWIQPPGCGIWWPWWFGTLLGILPLYPGSKWWVGRCKVSNWTPADVADDCTVNVHGCTVTCGQKDVYWTRKTTYHQLLCFDLCGLLTFGKVQLDSFLSRRSWLRSALLLDLFVSPQGAHAQGVGEPSFGIARAGRYRT